MRSEASASVAVRLSVAATAPPPVQPHDFDNLSWPVGLEVARLVELESPAVGTFDRIGHLAAMRVPALRCGSSPYR